MSSSFATSTKFPSTNKIGKKETVTASQKSRERILSNAKIVNEGIDVIEILDDSPELINLCDEEENEPKTMQKKQKTKHQGSNEQHQNWITIQQQQQIEEMQLAQAIAESNRAVIEQQDNEYYESLWRDQQKEHQRLLEQKQQKENDFPERKLPEDSSSFYDSERSAATEDLKQQSSSKYIMEANLSDHSLLEEEPVGDSEPSTRIAFRMPCSFPSPHKRIVRKFRSKSTARQLYLFIQTLLNGTADWRLYPVIGGGELSESSDQTLEELHLAPHGVVLVRYSS